MSSGADDTDKNEPASQHKLDKAHERGSVVRSQDVTFATILAMATFLAYGSAESSLRAASRWLGQAWMTLQRRDINASSALEFVRDLSWRALALLAPVLALIWLAGAVAGALQAKGVFTAEPLKPDFNRVNPAEGLKRVFTIRSLHEVLRNSFKLSVLAAAGYVWGKTHVLDLLGTQGLAPGRLLHTSILMIGQVLALTTACYVVFAMIDWSFNRWEFHRRMRMSKHEVKEEHKSREGDPRIKSRLRELRLELAKKSRSVARVKESDVLLTNPTHYAIALKYVHGDMPAPQLLAKGSGEHARRLRQEAVKCGIPVVEHPPLTRLLYATVETDQFIPESEFHQVARILRWVYAGRRHGSSTRSYS